MLRVENLSKSFVLHVQGALRVDAVRDVSFTVGRGEFVGLAGPSGSGKSSILKCIHRTYLPSSGNIFLETDGKTVDLATLDEGEVLELRRTVIGFVSQFLRVIPRVSALDLVAEPLRHRLGMPAEEARREAQDLLLRLRIPRTLHGAYPATFSGGEQQRVNIARAVGWKPPLLLLDEPTASLDAASAAVCMELLSGLRQEGCTLLGIFHDRTLLESAADRIVDLGTEP